ncbi:MmpS family transport accessory protein [Nocardia sp. NPDC003963]
MADPVGEQRHRPGRPGEHETGPDRFTGPSSVRHRFAWRPAGRQWGIGGVVLLVLCLVGGCLAVVAGGSDESSDRSDDAVIVSYHVEGTGDDVSVTYLGSDFGMARETSVTPPWRREVILDGFGTMVSLIAINDVRGGAVTCRILVGDRVVSEQTSSGSYASAGCSGDTGVG